MVVDREDFARRPGDDLGLKPPVLGTAPGMDLPEEIGRDATDIADQRVLELAVTDRAAHRRAGLHPIAGRELAVHT